MKYAGIGSRETPPLILEIMENFARYFAIKGYLLRTGGAVGADTSFEVGADSLKGMGQGKVEIFHAQDCTEAAMKLSAKYHPNWAACKPYVRKLHGRNAMILLGAKLDDPVDFVLCWTPEGKGGGGTGQGIRIARGYGIPVIDLGGNDLEYIFSTFERRNHE